MVRLDFITVHRLTSANAGLSQQLCMLRIFVLATQVAMQKTSFGRCWPMQDDGSLNAPLVSTSFNSLYSTCYSHLHAKPQHFESCNFFTINFLCCLDFQPTHKRVIHFIFTNDAKRAKSMKISCVKNSTFIVHVGLMVVSVN